jgi:general secretion pathway protein D
MKNLFTLGTVGCLLVGCAAEPMIPPKLDVPARPIVVPAATGDGGGVVPPSGTVSIEENPTPPAVLPKVPPVAAVPGAAQAADVTLNFESLPLPAFIQTVYATVLKRNVSIDPAIMARKDLVTLRTGKPITATEAEESTRLLLKSYGIAVTDIGGLLRIVPDNANSGYMPEIRRGRALPDTPLPLRPIFQLIELQAVRNTEIVSYVRTLFGEKIKMTEDPGRNSVLLAGNGDDVQAAMEAIQMLDQPLFKGRSSVRITPLIWSADELAKRLTEILTQEGYAVGTTTNQGGVQFPITLLPVSGLNSIIVFSQSKEVVNHILEWAKVLDKPAEKSVGRSFFSYQVKNTDASRLAETVQQLLQGGPARNPASVTPGTAAPVAGFQSNNVVVDKATNTLLFRASGEDYTDVIRLLRELDRTARQVLIEVTVAEVNLSDKTTIGVDWIFTRLNRSGLNVTALGGNTGVTVTPNSSISGANALTGFVVGQLDGLGNARVILSALASNNKANVLSSPRVLARNGETASIQVGDEVPVLTSQQTSSATGSTGLISTVQYKSTGVILKIKPVVHSSDQVDLEITQEVSTVKNTTTGVSNSPTISKKSLDTKLTLKHGSTYVLGGLISNTTSKVSSGVPFLKDIPVLGQAFKTSTDEGSRDELIILITPYIMSDDTEARAVTEAFRKQLGPWAEEKKLVPAAK